MSSMIEDFPTPVSPTRRMVYDLFADVLIIPFLRDSTSLEKMIRRIASKKRRRRCDLLERNFIFCIRTVLVWAIGIEDIATGMTGRYPRFGVS